MTVPNMIYSPVMIRDTFRLTFLAVTLSAGWNAALAVTITPLPLDADYSHPSLKINDLGQVVGLNRFRVTLYRNGVTTDLGAVPGMQKVFPYAINNLGQIVGNRFTSSSTGRPILYTGSAATDPGVLPTAHGVSFHDINNSGQIVGVTWTYHPEEARFDFRAFQYSGGRIDEFPDLMRGSSAVAVNDLGQVAGFDKHQPPISRGYVRGFVYTAGRGVTYIGERFEPRDINNAGQVVGFSWVLSSVGGIPVPRPFLYREGVLKDLLGEASLGGTGVATAINTAGQTVGWTGLESAEPSQHTNAFLYSNGVLRDLDSLLPPNSGWSLNVAIDINNTGQIVGFGLKGGQPRCFLLDLRAR
jgi:probable HAF family extracellular repeat protein